MPLERLTKQPSENRLYDVDFVNNLASGATAASIAAATAVVIPPGAGTLTVVGSSVSGTKGQVRLSGGVDGESYKVTVRINASNGDVLEHEFILDVRDL